MSTMTALAPPTSPTPRSHFLLGLAAGGASPPPYDWNNPAHIAAEFSRRAERLAKIRADKSGRLLAVLRVHYAHNPADFINDWGTTFDPRNGPNGLPSVLPFVLFPRQREFVEWVDRLRRQGAKGLADKSRDMGFSWLLVSIAATACLFGSQMTFGFGSRDEDSVDKIGDPDSLFWKLRFFIENLPEEFRGDWSAKRDSAHMRVSFPTTGSVVTGDAGKNIGRGGRSQVYVVDEAAALENPVAVEASLSQTTNCRIDVSTPKGMGNPFAQKRHSGKFPVFSMHWRDDPRKNDGVKRYLIPDADPDDPASWETWYDKQKRELDPVTLAQEVDLDYSASATGVLIPSAWVQAAVDAHVKLGIEITGEHRAALDVADEGVDDNALAKRHGVLVRDVTGWSGSGSDIFRTVQRAFDMCDEDGIETLDYDADGLGAGVRGDARVINDGRRRPLKVEPFRGSGAVFKPEDPIPTATPVTRGDRSERKNERRNKDYFQNAKAQAWWELRVRFMRTHRALEVHAAGEDWRTAYDADDLISLDGSMRELAKLCMELSQPTAQPNTAGKQVIDKAPAGTRSPNLADAVMIVFAPRRANWFDLVGKG